MRQKKQNQMTPQQFRGVIIAAQHDRIRKLKNELPKEVTFLSPIQTKDGVVIEYHISGQKFRITYPENPTQADYGRIKQLILTDHYELSRS